MYIPELRGTTVSWGWLEPEAPAKQILLAEDILRTNTWRPGR